MVSIPMCILGIDRGQNVLLDSVFEALLLHITFDFCAFEALKTACKLGNIQMKFNIQNTKNLTDRKIILSLLPYCRYFPNSNCCEKHGWCGEVVMDGYLVSHFVKFLH